MRVNAIALVIASIIFTASCGQHKVPQIETSPETSFSKKAHFYGTLNPYAEQAIYFALTDRFVDGDSSNNHPNQGGDYPTFNRPLIGPNGETANVGYMGGDFKGVLNNAQYIQDMGFTSVWLTPIHDNPDQSFAGGEEVSYGAYYKDGGKTGYHGYWGVNFFEVDEHLPSKDLNFQQLTQALKQQHDLDFVLDIVGNHGSPSYSMPFDQAKFGEIYDQDSVLIAGHQNIHPENLDKTNPLHQFYNQHTGLAQLSDIDENNPAVLDYFEAAYLKWIDQGAHALRVDTIKEMPHAFWQKLFTRIRAKHPDIFIFGESFSFEAEFIAQHTKPENGGASVLDFPGRKAITEVFENDGSDFQSILSYLHLDTGVYANPYELMTFYDNHDMSRMNASDEGFINANNWLFTSRGIPVIYYGSEVNFMTGKAEHEGNRNYFGQERIEQAKSHPIQQNLTRIANIRRNSPALQKGLQVNLEFAGNKASFLRIFQNGGVYQTALVLLNKGNQTEQFEITEMLSSGTWIDAFSGESLMVVEHSPSLVTTVAKNDVKVLLFNDATTNAELLDYLKPSAIPPT
jgi:glycosidase